jgi:hypothetical protein
VEKSCSATIRGFETKTDYKTGSRVEINWCSSCGLRGEAPEEHQSNAGIQQTCSGIQHKEIR